jgi:WD40 repeat protein
VQMITLCDGGNRLVSCSLDQTLKIFDVNTSMCIATLKVLALLALVGEGWGNSCLSI